MAKRRLTLLLERMENSLGYTADALNHSERIITRFYTDLRPVIHEIYERTLREFENFELQQASKSPHTYNFVLPERSVPKLIAQEGDTVTIARTSSFGFYSFAGDVHYDFGLDLALLLTRNEALKTMHISRLNPHTIHGLGPLFSKLPRELREKIYDFAHPNGTWKPECIDSYKCELVENVGDLSGFYYPLTNLSILNVNKKMRREALPFAYRSTMFRVDDMDELVKLLMAIGRIGRDNIESVEFSWQIRIGLNTNGR